MLCEFYILKKLFSLITYICVKVIYITKIYCVVHLVSGYIVKQVWPTRIKLEFFNFPSFLNKKVTS